MTGWESARLGDLCKIDIGKTPSRGVSRYWDKGRETDNVWLSIADLTQSQGGQICDSKEYVSNEAARSLKLVKAGTLLMSFKLSIGKMSVAGRDLFTNEAIAALTILNSKVMSREYLQYFFSGYDWEAATAGDHKVKGKTLNKAKLKELIISFPPLPEQQRIVGILDQAFEKIAKARANAERNLANAKELSRSFLESLVAADGAAWNEEHLEDLVTDDCSLSYGIVQPGDEFEGGIPIVRPTDMSAKHIGLDGLKRVNPKVTYAYERTNLRGGELLLCVRGTTGLVSIAEAKLSGSNVTRGIVPMRFDENRIDGEYAFYAFISDYVQRQIKSKTYGSTLMQINIRDVRKIKIPLPDRNKQKGIAMRCREVLDLSDEMYRNSHQKIVQIGTLQQALLSQAFSGNL